MCVDPYVKSPLDLDSDIGVNTTGNDDNERVGEGDLSLSGRINPLDKPSQPKPSTTQILLPISIPTVTSDLFATTLQEWQRLLLEKESLPLPLEQNGSEVARRTLIDKWEAGMLSAVSDSSGADLSDLLLLTLLANATELFGVSAVTVGDNQHSYWHLSPTTNSVDSDVCFSSSLHAALTDRLSSAVEKQLQNLDGNSEGSSKMLKQGLEDLREEMRMHRELLTSYCFFVEINVDGNHDRDTIIEFMEKESNSWIRDSSPAAEALSWLRLGVKQTGLSVSPILKTDSESPIGASPRRCRPSFTVFRSLCSRLYSLSLSSQHLTDSGSETDSSLPIHTDTLGSILATIKLLGKPIAVKYLLHVAELGNPGVSGLSQPFLSHSTLPSYLLLTALRFVVSPLLLSSDGMLSLQAYTGAWDQMETAGAGTQQGESGRINTPSSCVPPSLSVVALIASYLVLESRALAGAGAGQGTIRVSEGVDMGVIGGKSVVLWATEVSGLVGSDCASSPLHRLDE